MVLLILAGITIVYVFGDNGIFKLAQEAKDKTEQAKLDEQNYLNNLENMFNGYLNGNVGTTKPDNPDTPTPEEPEEVPIENIKSNTNSGGWGSTKLRTDLNGSGSSIGGVAPGFCI